MSLFPDKKILALIPARGGSKRIPRKNIRLFADRPIIEYPIKAAIKANCFTEIMVSTDDAEIAEFAKQAGAKVPFFRSEVNSGDHAIVNDVIAETLAEYEKQGQYYDYLCCILPTAVFISPEQFSKSLKVLVDGDYDAVIPIVKYSHPIQRAFKIEEGKLLMLYPENFRKRTQDLESFYYDSGTFYWLNVSRFLQKKATLTDNTGAFEIPESECRDIDTEEDWRLAEMLFKAKNR
ncbi:MAG: pseudaminic acid cytidylyltransferase [Candidatus Nanoarchaeia archaeon]